MADFDLKETLGVLALVLLLPCSALMGCGVAAYIIDVLRWGNVFGTIVGVIAFSLMVLGVVFIADKLLN